MRYIQLIDHGVDESLMEKVKKGMEELFNLPMEEKKKYWQTKGDLQGFGQLFVVSEEQKLDWADLFYFITLPTSLRKTHLFPRLPQPFKYMISLSLQFIYAYTHVIINFRKPMVQVCLHVISERFGRSFQIQI